MKVSQIDLVPTVSLLFGLPIPFSNLGSVILDLFNRTESGYNRKQSLIEVTHALRHNAYQVNAYLASYAKKSNEFPRDKYERLESIFQSSENSYQVNKLNC